ncbi:F0F1 ATP synthase subunit epsilon [Roseomonas sp. HF4]|uniref:F0F1 ATP synthase subunit epsilon n=1 Tax=Roseomonas sp. HF4 TaxID=2562313 RepID=UPI00197D3E1E|nr:F0F1 ATP synthase subunit epsilon [Roseomonas sp. HF4]
MRRSGAFGLLPRHVDFVTALVPGILIHEAMQGSERYLGVDEGILVKLRHEVLVSTHDAVAGDHLEELRGRVRSTFIDLGKHERAARTSLARLEAGIACRMLGLRETGP